MAGHTRCPTTTSYLTPCGACQCAPLDNRGQCVLFAALIPTFKEAILEKRYSFQKAMPIIEGQIVLYL